MNATLIPPPVRGWRMLRASPRQTTPGRMIGTGGSRLLGITRIRSTSTAARNAGRMCSVDGESGGGGEDGGEGARTGGEDGERRG